MARPQTLRREDAIAAAAGVFVRLGYEGTSVDDLLGALGVHRGSLYHAFGSKRGLFVAVLRDRVADLDHRAGPVPAEALDLLLVAALDRGQHDPEVAGLVRAATGSLRRLAAVDDGGRPGGGPPGGRPDPAAAVLGARLLDRMTAPDTSGRPEES